MSKVANWLLGLAQSAASKRGSKLKVELSEQNISVRFESVEDNENSMWKHYYSGAGLFFDDSPQELQLDPQEIRDAKVDVVKTANVAPILKTNIFSKMWLFDEKNDRESTMITATTVMVGVVLVLTLVM